MTTTPDVPPVTFTCDSDAVGWIIFDTPGARANVFNEVTQRAFAVALDEAERSAARALVIVSAKERIFIAGADLRWLQTLADAGAAEAFSRAGQRLFERVATFRAPVVAAIHGACAGGGFEVALAAHWRIATDAVVTRVGFPETSVGTIPGWGGCVRLPRLVGLQSAVDHILKPGLMEAGEALAAGFVDELSPAAALKDRAKAAALRLVTAGLPHRRAPAPPPAGFMPQARQAAAAKRHQPALLAAFTAIEEGSRVSVAEAYGIEAREFGRVTAGIECKNLVHVFFLREAAAKRTLEGWFHEDKTAPARAPVRRVGVVGAGVMGSGIAHWLASRGYDVVLRDVQVELVERALGVIQALLDDGVRRGKTTPADAKVVFGRIRTTTSWEGFADCDLVIEAIVEDVAAKRQLFAELAAIVRPDALLASNSSALPIEETAGHVPRPERTLGIHFFNPVSRMPLVELIIGPATSAEAARRALDVVRALGKSPVICRSSPGFVVTRVLFFYLNAAVRRWEQGIEATVIDGALMEFGWPMGPMRLIDEVGTDVTAFIFGEMAQAFPERFVATGACQALVQAGLKGRKNGASRGFYRYDGGHAASNEAEARAATTATPGATREPVPAGTVVGGQPVLEDLMRVMVEEARRCVEEQVVRSADDVDFALISGAGFPVFRGGLLRWGDGTLLRRE